MEQIFRSIFWIGVISIASSLFIDYATSIGYFILAFCGGILVIVYSLYEQYLLKTSQTPVAPVPQSILPTLQQPALVAKKLVPLKEIHAFDLPSSSPLPLKQGFFTRLFSHFHHKPTAKQTSTGLSIASLDNVKELFSTDLHLQQQQKIGTFQKPTTSQPVSFSRVLQQPKTPSLELTSQRPSLQSTSSSELLLPFEEGLEHYIPIGAEQLTHDHHNRYAEDREVISQSSDTRYQQVSPQQRTPLSSPHHLSLLHYLHYKDRKHEKYLFIMLLCVSLILIGISLFISFQEYIAFVVSLLFLGLTLLSASVAELIHLHKHPLTTLLSQPVQTPSSEPILPKTMPQLAQQPVVQPTKPIASQQTAPATQQPSSSSSTEHLSTLVAYVQQSLQQKYPLEAIRAAAQQSGWPVPLIEQALLVAQPKTAKKKKVMTLLVLVVALIVLLLLLNSSDMFLLPYWVSSLSDASPQFYFIMIGIFLLVILLFVRKVRKAYQVKQIRYKVAEDKQVNAIKEELQRMPTSIVRGTYETDFDKLYRLISEKQKLTITEVAQGFNVSRKEAEEWGKILKEQGLIELHYPTVGDLELLWKK
ncbi:hypothetical protein J4208_05335 [Candidatus Woesearchaeota archaeon]|nr:hypothetical protein [Candidatus Woesearchaeota archaeon]